MKKRYELNLNDIDLLSIFGKEKLEKIQSLISDVTGIAFVTIDYKGCPLTKMTNFTQRCTCIRHNPICKQICELSDAQAAIKAAITKKTSIYLCPFNMLEVAIPIIINDKYLGALIGGQIDCPNPPEDIFKTDEKWITGYDYIKDLTGLDKLSSGKVLSYDQFEKSVKLVEFIIKEIMSNEIKIYKLKANYKEEKARLNEQIGELKVENENLNKSLSILSNKLNKIIVKDMLESLSNLSFIEDTKTTKYYINNLSYLITNLLDKKIEYIARVKEIILSYFKIKKIQYQDRFSYNIDLYDIKKTTLIPYRSLIFYTILMVHLSLRYLEDDYFINISIKQLGNKLEVHIKDNGLKLNPKSLGKLENKHIFDLEYKEIIDYMAYINNKINLDNKNSIKINTKENKGNLILITYNLD